MHGSVCKLRESIQEVVYGSVCVVIRKIYRKFVHGNCVHFMGGWGGVRVLVSMYIFIGHGLQSFSFFYYSCYLLT